MGCGTSRSTTGTFYSYRNSAERDESSNRVNSFLATLPKLFAETNVGGIRFLTTCNVAENFKTITFACTDLKDGIFKKAVTQEELKEIVRFISDSITNKIYIYTLKKRSRL